MSKKKKIMVFGVFDFLHQGHVNFLKQAKKLGSFLVVSVARDVNVLEAKGHLPVFPEKERLRRVSGLDFVNEAILGGVDNPWTHILEQKPDIVALGYDQGPYLTPDLKSLEKELCKRGLNTQVVRLKKVSNHKTNKMRKITGKVQKNLGRGTKLGFPTANLRLRQDYPEGIYLAWTILNGQKLPSLVFIGIAKTFDEPDRKLEVYILDFDEPLYGKNIEIELVRKIRDNKKFKSTTALIKAMGRDEMMARKFFNTTYK